MQFPLLYIIDTEHSGRVVSTPASCFGASGFKSRLWDRLSQWGLSCLFLVLPVKFLYNNVNWTTAVSFHTIYNSLFINHHYSWYVMYSVLLTSSLNTLQTKYLCLCGLLLQYLLHMFSEHFIQHSSYSFWLLLYLNQRFITCVVNIASLKQITISSDLNCDTPFITSLLLWGERTRQYGDEWWRQYALPKRRSTSTRLHGAISQNTHKLWKL
jgi:hypothetical protein